MYGKSRVATYACADGELALEFDPRPGANVTVTLVVTDATDADLDLFVVDGKAISPASFRVGVTRNGSAARPRRR